MVYFKKSHFFHDHNERKTMEVWEKMCKTLFITQITAIVTLANHWIPPHSFFYFRAHLSWWPGRFCVLLQRPHSTSQKNVIENGMSSHVPVSIVTFLHQGQCPNFFVSQESRESAMYVVRALLLFWKLVQLFVCIMKLTIPEAVIVHGTGIHKLCYVSDISILGIS